MSYSKEELQQLHITLYEILTQVIEACERLGVRYFIIGGSAIGAHFDGAILPWDDDIDIGMEREDYERFCREAEGVLPKGYTLQSPLNEPNTPYYFAKVRKDDTLFIAEDEQGLDMHHGIYVDIFPFDRVPDNRLLERLQRGVVRILNNAFVASVGKLKGGRWALVPYRAVSVLLPKSLIFKLLHSAQCVFNRCDTRRVTIVRMDRDHIERKMLHPTDRVDFGALRVAAPRELRRYLEWHYIGLTRDVKSEDQINHRPITLKF
ncbi:MAG: LicD family protein [Rikenellaceae bacterium]